MSTVAARFRIAADSKDLTQAKNEAEGLAKHAAHVTGNIDKWAGALSTAYVGMSSINSAVQFLSDSWDTASARAYDFSSNMDNDLRTQYIWMQEQQNVINAELEKSADWYGEIGNKIQVLGTGISKYFNAFLSDGESAQKQAERIFDEIVKAKMAVDGLTSDFFINEYGPDGWFEQYSKEYKKYADEIESEQKKVAKDMEDTFKAAYEMQYTAADLTLDRVEKRQMLNGMKIAELRRQATNAETDALRDFYNWQADELDKLFAKNEEYYSDLEKTQQEAKDRQIQREIDTALMIYMTEQEQAQRRYELYEEDQKLRLKSGEINLEQYGALVAAAWTKRNDDINAINKKANDEAIKQAEETAKGMADATSSALSIIDDDIAHLFDSLNSLSGVLQNLGWLSGSGGMFGIGGGFSGGAMSSYGGVNVGSLSVTVNGGTERTAQNAQEGVNNALAGIVREQMAQERRYGGLFNPKQSVQTI